MKAAKEIARRHYENPYSNWENGIEALTKEIEEYATQEVAKNLHKPLVSGELIDFLKWIEDVYWDNKGIEDCVNTYLKYKINNYN